MIKWSELKAAIDKIISDANGDGIDPEIVYIDFSYADTPDDVHIFLDCDSKPATLTIL